MKKKSGNKNLDNDLDFGDLDDLEAEGGMDFGDLEDIDMSSRKPSTGEVAKEMAKEAGHGFLDSVARKSAEKALPESYKDNYYAAVDYADFAKETFQASKDKINKSLYNLGKEVKKILPFQSKMLDNFLSKYETDFEAFKSQTEEQIREGSIQSNLSSIFDKQLEITKAIESKRSAEDQADRKQNLAISKVNLDVLTSIDNNLSNQTAFTLQISKEYYRKSLELQYKSYFVQADMLKDMRDYYKGFSIQFEEIKKNTSLPDFVKLHTSERVSELMRTQFIQNTYKQFFSNSEYMQNVKKRMTNLINEKVSTITDGLDNATEAIGGLNQAGEFGGGGGRVLGGILSNMGGGILGEKLADKISPKIKDKIKDNKYINAGGNYLDMMANSPRSLFAMLRGKTKDAQSQYSDEGTPLRFLASKLLGGADELLGATDPGMEKFEVKKQSILDHNKPAIFDNKVHRSITEVIPMYLAKILSENTHLREMYESVNKNKLKNFKGSPNTEEQVYDYENRKLSTKQAFRESIQKSVFKDTGKESKKISSVANNISSLALSSVDKTKDKETYKVLNNKAAQKSFQEFLATASARIKPEDFNYDNLVTNIDKDPGLKELVSKNKNLELYINNLKTLNLSKKHKNLNEKVKDAIRVYPTLGVIELFKNTSKIVGSKGLNLVDPNAANLISKTLSSYIDARQKPITIDTIINGECFMMMNAEDSKVCLPYLQVFIPQVKQIKAYDDMVKNSEFAVLLSFVNESLFKSFEFNPNTFQTLYDFSPDLQEEGKLTKHNLIEGMLGKGNRDQELVDPSLITDITRRGNKNIKKIIEARTKITVVDQLQNSTIGQELNKFTDIFSKFQQDVTDADGAKGIGSAIKSMVSSVAKQTQESAKKAYGEVTNKLSKSYDDIEKLLKDKSPDIMTKVKNKMLETSSTYIDNIEQLIKQEEETRKLEEAKFAEMSQKLRESLEDDGVQNLLVRTQKTMVKAKTEEIALLKKFKGNLQASRNRIASIDTTNGIDIKQFRTNVKDTYSAFIKEAKDALAEFEAKADQTAAVV